MPPAIVKRKRDENGDSLLKDEVEFSRLDTPFPRGGGSDIAPLEIRRAAAEATSDVYEQMVKSKKQKKGKSKPSVPAVPLTSRIEPFSFNKIKIGTLVLGAIADVRHSSSELVVSLPNNLVGYCTSDNLDRKQIGRYLRFAVTEVGEAPKRRLALSSDPDLVNQTIDSSELTNGLAVQGLVESIEEKGVVLNLGDSLGQGFLPVSSKDMSNYQVGEALMAFVKDSERRIKPLTLDSNFSAATVLSQPALVPGTLLKSAPVNKTSSMGCVYDLFGHIPATSDAVHSRGENSAVRVLFSHPPLQINGERHLGVSRVSHILDLNSSIEDIKVGKVLNGTVTNVMPNLGLLLDFNVSGGAIQSGFAHISQIEGSEEVNLEENTKYAVGTEHQVRVTGASSLDGIAYLSLDESVISQKYMTIEDVSIGDVVPNAVVDRILPKGGVLIRVSKGIVGIASEHQLSDVAMRNPELKYKTGQKVSVRVLNVDIERERVELTLKKSLVAFEGPILSSYDTLNGQETVGTVIRTIDAGAKILFFGGVRGLLPTSEMSETGAKPEDLVRVGQTVRVHVLETDASRDRLVVSSRPVSELNDHIGQVFVATVTSRNKHEVRVALQPNNLGEATLIGNGSVDSGKKLKVNDETQVKVLTDRLVSNDPAIIDSELPQSVDQMALGQQYVGFVSGTQPKVGVFVGFGGGLIGLIPSNTLGQSEWPAVGKVIKVTVENIDLNKNRVFLSLPSAARSVSATISGVKSMQLNVVTDDGSHGRVDISQVYQSLEEIKDPRNPLKPFQKGQKLDTLYVIGRHDAREYGSFAKGSRVVLDLSFYKPTTSPTLRSAGSKVLAFVNNYSDDKCSLWVTLTPTTRGQLSLVDLSTDSEILSEPQQHIPVGSALEVTILKSGPKPALTALTAPSDLALVFKVDPLRLMVRLPYHKTAAVACVDSGDVFAPLKSSFKPGDIVRFNREGDSSSHITLRSESHEVVKEGEVRKGYVSNIAAGGVFVALAPNVVGRVQIGQLSDTYLKNWKTFVRIGDVVDAKVLSNSGKIELSLKPSVVTGRKQQNVDKVDTDHNYNGVVRRVETFGVFVDFKGVTGLCHKSEISDQTIDDLARVFKVGDKVRVKVLSKDESSGKLSLGMKAKYFEDDEDEDDDEDDDEEVSQAAAASSEDEDMSADDFEAFEDESDNGSGNSDDEDESESELDVELDTAEQDSSDKGEDEDESDNESSGQALSAGFNWSGDLPGPADDKSASDSEESDSDNEPRQRRRRKREEFVRDETASLQTKLPQSAKDFERLLVSTPNSSILWMNYMAFQLQLGEVDGAREIARRALKTIPQREEEEKLNIWVALLNLEAQFGTPESTEKAFREAQQFMDSLTIHLRMGTVYAQAGKIKQAADIYKRAHKRFGGESMEPWLAEMRFLFTAGENKSVGRSLADQALQRLPTRMHRDFTRQFALLEFELGDAERGRTLFEALLASAPKRVDIWNVYIDQEIKKGNAEEKIAALFDRVLQQRISMKQAKFFFKKWIDVATDQDYVKLRAREYVENRENASKQDEEDDQESDQASSEESE